MNSDSAETRNRILNAARQVINQRGYQAATFQAIAFEADLSRPSLHYYFASREQIYETLVAEAVGVMAECIAKAQKQVTAIEQLSALVAAVHDEDTRHRAQIAFLVSARLEGMRNPELRPPSGIGLGKFLRTLVHDAIVRGELPDDTSAEPIVDMLLAVMFGMGFYAGYIGSAVDMASIGRQLDRLFSHGLLGAAGGLDSGYDTFGDTPRTVVGQP